ncbi:exosome complex component MTR3-like [Oscarella lobularis]|uniref:exosome complex component MTR3-like n=1 Tax=Oscarella lobularis TaxID=121494 RepID=UPI003313802E
MSFAIESVPPIDASPSETPVLRNGQRADGRQNSELRPTYLKKGVVNRASGSAYLETDETKVICSVYGPRDVGKHDDFLKGKVSCYFKFLPFSTIQRQASIYRTRQERELGCLMEKTLESAICLEKFPRAEIDVYVNIIQDGGNAFSAAMTCASTALADAGIEMYDLVPSCSVACKSSNMLLDPTPQELSAPSSDGSLVLSLLPGSNEVASLFSEGRVDSGTLIKALRESVDGCVRMHAVMRQALTETEK